MYVNVSGLNSAASMAEFADRYGLTLGNFYYARDYSEITGRSAAEALKKKEDRNLFLFDLNRSIDAWNEADLFYYVLDGKLLGYGKPIEGLEERQVNIWDYEYHYTMEVTENTAEAEMIDGFLFLHENGYFQSPQFQLPVGDYELIIEGENLLDCVPTIISSEKSRIIEQEMQKITGEVSCKNTGSVCIEIENPSDHDMVLYQLRIIPREE